MSGKDWSSSRFGCCSKGLCDCVTSACPCYTGGMTTQKLESQHWCIGCCLYVVPGYACYRRSKVREAYKIEGGFLSDWCTWCCLPCNVCQEAREVDANGNAAPPSGQAMG